MSTDIVPNGALFDTRPQKEKDKDYNAKEIAGTHHVIPFRHLKPIKLEATVYSQEHTSSCVVHAIMTQLEYEKIVKPKPRGLSQLLAYRKRINYAGEGSAAVDIYNRIQEGQSKNSVAPVHDKHTEREANALPYITGDKLISEFSYFGITDYTTIPATVSTGKAVVVFIYATKEEWAQEYVTVKTPNLDPVTAYIRHAVCLVPQGDFKENNKEWLAVHDSASFGGRHLRYIAHDFLLKRAFYASKAYPKTSFPTPEPPVTEVPTAPVKFQDEGKAVRNLQGFLIKEGLLESQYQTGYYGQLTAKALLEWQLLHYSEFNYIRPVRELLSLEGKYFGQQSIDIINK